jgi:hypothetical protein
VNVATWSWIETVASAAIAAGTFATLSAGWSYVQTRVRRRADLKALAVAREEAALTSSDIEQVGGYLFEAIGSVRISDYVRDQAVRQRTGRALRRLTDFLGPQEPVAEEPPALGNPDEGLGPEELRLAEEQILSGETWNGLARMRRFLELALREVAPHVDRREGAGALISRAAHDGVLPQEAVPALRYAVSVANSAIHGEPVPTDVALEALASARAGLGVLADR